MNWYVGCVLFGGYVNAHNIARRLDVSPAGSLTSVTLGFVMGAVFLGLPLAGVLWIIRSI